MADFCLTLICPPTVEEKLLDVLLANAGSQVFTSTPTHSHGSGQQRLSATEQVMGAQPCDTGQRAADDRRTRAPARDAAARIRRNRRALLSHTAGL